MQLAKTNQQKTNKTKHQPQIYKTKTHNKQTKIAHNATTTKIQINKTNKHTHTKRWGIQQT